MQNRTSLIDQCKSLCSKGKSHGDIVEFLRTQGCSKVESIAVIAKALAVGIVQAKAIVHSSSAWADRRERDEEFHASLEAGLDILKSFDDDSCARK